MGTFYKNKNHISWVLVKYTLCTEMKLVQWRAIKINIEYRLNPIRGTSAETIP